jgi:transcriptional regulator with XRE-family HTH domain
MTPAEFRTIRESLGLSAQALADIIGITQERTIRRWEDGTRPLPADAAERLSILDTMAETIAQQGIQTIQAHPEAVEIVVIRYERNEDFPDGQFPHANCIHAAALGRLKRTAPERVKIIGFEPDKYFAWLGDRQDTQGSRSEWAATK